MNYKNKKGNWARFSEKRWTLRCKKEGQEAEAKDLRGQERGEKLPQKAGGAKAMPAALLPPQARSVAKAGRGSAIKYNKVMWDHNPKDVMIIREHTRV